ncbi:MAG: prepilin-type N-terminal cleavage/methylation domain-containing protein [Nitrospirae bacterium]|nr:prepilin-type N-terminal cleavage/methylation domain-containing protein [Nitrospirota bacterium]
MRNFGFTLLEIAIALFLISIFLMLALPSVTILTEDTIKADAKRLASVLNELNIAAIAKKESAFIRIDIDRSLVSWQTTKGERSIQFGRLSYVKLESKGTIRNGTVTVFFGPFGIEENMEVCLNRDSDNLIVSINRVNGKIKILKE